MGMVIQHHQDFNKHDIFWEEQPYSTLADIDHPHFFSENPDRTTLDEPFSNWKTSKRHLWGNLIVSRVLCHSPEINDSQSS